MRQEPIISARELADNDQQQQQSKSNTRGRFDIDILKPCKLFTKRSKKLYADLSFAEISGSAGDLGTFIPLFTALAQQRSIFLAPALFFAGVCNILTGYSWDVPMCVQPMKSIAAVALAEGLTQLQVTTAGVTVGILVLFIGMTNLIEVVNFIVPPNVVSGIQLGVGLNLAIKGVKMVDDLEWIGGNGDCKLTAIFVALATLFWLREETQKLRDQDERREEGEVECSQTSNNNNTRGHRNNNNNNSSGVWNYYATSCFNPLRLLAPNKFHPVGIYLFLIGMTFGIVKLLTTIPRPQFQFFGEPIVVWALQGVTPADWKIGFLEGALPQIPLTTLNSVISVCALATALYPDRRKQYCRVENKNVVISRKEVCISVGLMNILFCLFGSMPNCHGAGGLAGQHRFGARHGSAVVFLGICKISLAIFFGQSVLLLLDAFPASILGIMLSIAGLELATTGYTLLVLDCTETRTTQDSSNNNTANCDFLKLRKNAVIATITCLVTLGLGATHYGALSGWLAHMVYGDGVQELSDFTRNYLAKRSNNNNNKGNASNDYVTNNRIEPLKTSSHPDDYNKNDKETIVFNNEEESDGDKV